MNKLNKGGVKANLSDGSKERKKAGKEDCAILRGGTNSSSQASSLDGKKKVKKKKQTPQAGRYGSAKKSLVVHISCNI